MWNIQDLVRSNRSKLFKLDFYLMDFLVLSTGDHCVQASLPEEDALKANLYFLMIRSMAW